MKKHTCHLLPIILALILLTAISGCGSPQVPSESVRPSAAPVSTEPAPSPSAAVQSPSPENSASPSPTENSASPSASQSPVTPQAVECNWKLEVNDTETTKINGYDFKCTLSVMAVKAGGKDELGTYNGTVKLNYEYSMNKGNVSGDATGGSGQDINATFVVGAYDDLKYSESAGPGDLGRVTAYDAMALGSLNMTGSGLSKENAGGGSWSTSDSETVAVPFRLAVDGGQVIIELISLVPGVQFKGMLTGTPVK